jgi:hypothetical protein
MEEALHIFPTKADVMKFNHQRLDDIENPVSHKAAGDSSQTVERGQSTLVVIYPTSSLSPFAAVSCAGSALHTDLTGHGCFQE